MRSPPLKGRARGRGTYSGTEYYVFHVADIHRQTSASKSSCMHAHGSSCFTAWVYFFFFSFASEIMGLQQESVHTASSEWTVFSTRETLGDPTAAFAGHDYFLANRDKTLLWWWVLISCLNRWTWRAKNVVELLDRMAAYDWAAVKSIRTGKHLDDQHLTATDSLINSNIDTSIIGGVNKLTIRRSRTSLKESALLNSQY